MEEISYPIFLNLKIPWLTRTFYYLFITSLILLFIFGIYMLPSENSSNEMKAAYFVLTTSELEKVLFIVGLLGTPVFLIFYKYIRIKRKALLILLGDKMEIDNFRTITSYPIKEITNINCNDVLTKDGFPKGKLTIDFKDKSNTVTSITLSDYNQSDQLMNTLLNYENIKFDVTNFSHNPEVLG